MAGVKIEKFLGIAPKISPELLPNTAGQIANNCKLYSGDLIPYPQPVVVDNTERTGTIRTIYALRNPNTQELEWLSWLTDVNIARLATDEDNEQRFYYTGDGAPKVSNYELATTGAEPYPVTGFDLGLPLPPDGSEPTTVASVFTVRDTASYARDSGNIATLVTSTAHGLRSGSFITVSGFTFITGTYNQPGGTTVTITINGHGIASGATVSLDFTTGAAVDGAYSISNVTTNTFDIVVGTAATTSGNVNLDLRSFNATNVECTVINSTTITYFSPGFQVATYAYTAGRVDLGGLTQARSYLFTWVTPWFEESIGSPPSDELFIREGITVTVSGLPTAPPAGNYFIRGIRLYRTLPTASGTEYFRLQTLWFPGTLARVQRTSNVSRVTLTDYHNLDIDDRFKISGASVASFDITGGVVTDVIDNYTFEYAQVGADVASTAATGTLFHDIAQKLSEPARYWGDGTYDFTDDFDSRLLLSILESDEYDAPPENLQGLVLMQNNIYVGFDGNQLYFSEPGLPHAWPRKYIRSIEDNIVALAVIGGFLLVLTEAYPYQVVGTDPSVMRITRIDAPYACVSKRSVVSMSYGVVYSSHDGLALYSPSAGPIIITRAIQNQDTWNTGLDPTTITGVFYGDSYFGSHSTGSIVFERDDKVGGFFIDSNYQFTAAFYEPVTGKLFYVDGTNGDIYLWDDLTQPSVTQEWKSKVIITKDFINLGAARVVADYSDLTTLWDTTGSNWEVSNQLWNNTDQVTFRLWVDKQLIYTVGLNDVGTFRLPTGYKSDTFEVGVEGNVRIRSIHLAETPVGLQSA
jgi:hypothetical protein